MNELARVVLLGTSPAHTMGADITADFRQLAVIRLQDANALLDAGQWSGAYYLSGYAIECSLKACILKAMRRYYMPDKKVVIDSHTHDLTDLTKLAGMSGSRDQLSASNNSFARNWALVKDWNESSRYETWSEQDARDLTRAIVQRGSGVMAWTKKHW